MQPHGLDREGYSRLVVFTDVSCHQKSPGLLLCSTHLPNKQHKKHHKEGCGFQDVDLISLFLYWPKAARAGMGTGRAFYQARGKYLLENRRKCCQARRGHFSCSPPFLILTPFLCPGCHSAFMPLKRNEKSNVLHCWRKLWSSCPSVIIGAFVHADAKVNWIPW